MLKHKKIKSEIQARFDAAHVTARYSQFGELLQVGQVLYVSDGVVLQEQMGEVGGKAQIAYVWYPIVIQVQDGEVSAHRDVILQIEFQRQ